MFKNTGLPRGQYTLVVYGSSFYFFVLANHRCYIPTIQNFRQFLSRIFVTVVNRSLTFVTRICPPKKVRRRQRREEKGKGRE